MGKLRFLIALWAAKLSRPALKITGHNGTNFPGELALRLCPDFLARIGKPRRIVAVTGTNGKTTVNNMLCDALESRGVRLLDNRAGSNIDSGLATSLIIGSTLFGRARHDLAVFEIDERASLKIYPFIQPELIVVTNLFRDSIMRNGHPGYIADIMTRGIPKSSKLVLNADDLISCSLSPENPRAYFGIERQPGDGTECKNLINDMRLCPVCSGPLQYEYLRYHHIGRAECTDCGFRSPAYDYAARELDLPAKRMTAVHGDAVRDVALPSDSLVNAYNAVAVIAALCEFGLTFDEACAATERSKIVETRHQEEHCGDIRLVMQLAKEKNALAITRAFDYAAAQPGGKEFLLMMSCLNDEKNWSENTCWLYDCDFELLNGDDVARIIVSGPRAKDYKLRLLLAGVQEEKIFFEADELKAAELLAMTPGGTVFVFHGVDSFAVATKVKNRILARAAEGVS